MSSVACKMCGGECCGPCYDFCACRHCWNGWKTLKFRERLLNRVKQIWWDFTGKDPSA